VLVFDGAHLPGDEDEAGQIRFVFSRAPETADDVVTRLAAEWREGVVVVSSDRAIRQAASRVGSPVLTVTEFISALRSVVDEVVEDDDDPAPRDKRGNPRRLSREERAAQRAIRRLASGPF
jgi:predicted RNA-binding protein with PIN domain